MTEREYIIAGNLRLLDVAISTIESVKRGKEYSMDYDIIESTLRHLRAVRIYSYAAIRDDCFEKQPSSIIQEGKSGV